MAESNQSTQSQPAQPAQPAQPELEPDYLPMVGEIVNFRIRFGGSCEWDIG